MTKEVPYAAFYQNLHIGYALCGHAGFLRGAGRSGRGDRHRNWSDAPHIDLDELLNSETARQRWMDQLRRRDIALCALNCSGNPLAFQKDWEVTEKTFRLAKLLGVEKIVMMSGLPARLSRRQDPRLDHHQLAAGDPGHSGLSVERGGHPQVEGTGPHGGGLRHPSDCAGKPRDAAGVQPGDPVPSAGGRWPHGGHESGPLPPVLDGRRPHRGRPSAGGAGRSLPCPRQGLPPGAADGRPNGLLDTKPIDQFRARSWNYVAVGCGHGAQWWKEFFSTVRMAGYDGDVSLEMEDLTMPMLEGHLTSLRVLKEALVL